MLFIERRPWGSYYTLCLALLQSSEDCNPPRASQPALLSGLVKKVRWAPSTSASFICVYRDLGGDPTCGDQCLSHSNRCAQRGLGCWGRVRKAQDAYPHSQLEAKICHLDDMEERSRKRKATTTASKESWERMHPTRGAMAHGNAWWGQGNSGYVARRESEEWGRELCRPRPTA